MKNKQHCALLGFYSGKNCAQSVIIAYANELGIDAQQTINVATAFGGGMGSLQQTCGAVTASYMLIGMYNTDKEEDEKLAKENSRSMVQEFQKRFISINGSDQCKDLIKVNLRTEEGKEQFDHLKLKDKVCSKCIISAIKILESLFSLENSKFYK